MKFFIGLALFGIGIVLPLSAEAFTINPARYTITADPDSSQSLVLTVKNDADSATLVSLRVVGARQDEKGRPMFGAGLEVAEGWIIPEMPAVKIPPRSERKTVFNITVPPDAEPGSIHYLGLSVTAGAAAADQFGLATELVALVEIQVAGRAYEQITIREWQSLARIVSAFPWRLRLRLLNQGTTTVPLQGRLQISNWRGKKLYQQEAALGNQLIASAERKVEVAVMPPPRRLLPGIYRVALSVRYGRGIDTPTAVRTLLYVPRWSAIVTLIGTAVLVSLVSVVYQWRRRSRHSEL